MALWLNLKKCDLKKLLMSFWKAPKLVSLVPEFCEEFALFVKITSIITYIKITLKVVCFCETSLILLNLTN